MRRFSVSVPAGALSALALLACSAPEQQMSTSVPVPEDLHVAWRTGGALAIAPGRPLVELSDADGARIVIRSMESAPSADPLDLHVRYLAAPERPSPWLATSDRLSAYGVDSAPTEEEPSVLEAELAIPVGTTALVAIPTLLPELQLRLGARGGREFEVALAVGPVRDPHVAVLDTRLRPDRPLRLIVHGEPPLAVDLFAVPFDQLESGNESLSAALESLTETSGDSAEPGPGERALALALEAVREGNASRPAVVHLTRLLDVPCASDLALLATEEELRTFLERAAEELPPTRVAGTELESASAALALERTAYRFVLERASDRADEPAVDRARAFAGVLETHVGRVAGFPDALRDLLERATDLPHLHELLVAENLLWLADNEPSSRVVAFEWLKRRSAAPIGYDPLGPREERRAALAAEAERRIGGEDETDG